MNLKRIFTRISAITKITKAVPHLLIVLASANAFGLESDAEAEMTIQSDRAEFDKLTGVAVYKGRVILEQGTLLIKADQITLYSNDDQKLTKSIAVGKPAHYQQLMEGDEGPTKAQGHTITYLAEEKIITLLEAAILEQEGNSFSGNKIVYDIKNENIKAKGDLGDQQNGRIKMTIQPAKTAEVIK